MLQARDLLTMSNVRYSAYNSWPGSNVYISTANQLFGTFRDLKRAQSLDRNYLHWEAHHIVEKQDLIRLGISHRFPTSEYQLCILLPASAHRSRVSQILHSANPTGTVVSRQILRQSYVAAYLIIGDYCGGGEAAIRSELLAIVDWVLAMP